MEGSLERATRPGVHHDGGKQEPAERGERVHLGEKPRPARLRERRGQQGDLQKGGLHMVANARALAGNTKEGGGRWGGVRGMGVRCRTLNLARREDESLPPLAGDRHAFPQPRPFAPIAERSWWAGANRSPLPSYLAHYFWD